LRDKLIIRIVVEQECDATKAQSRNFKMVTQSSFNLKNLSSKKRRSNLSHPF